MQRNAERFSVQGFNFGSIFRACVCAIGLVSEFRIAREDIAPCLSRRCSIWPAQSKEIGSSLNVLDRIARQQIAIEGACLAGKSFAEFCQEFHLVLLDEAGNLQICERQRLSLRDLPQRRRIKRKYVEQRAHERFARLTFFEH